jgi:hypothetical protein
MAKSYSNDLKQKVITYLEAGDSYDKALKRFRIWG